LSGNIVKVIDTLNLDNTQPYRFVCEAKKMPFYAESEFHLGVALLITNPQII